MINEKQQSAAAQKFAEKWAGRGYEKGESQSFWIELLTEVFGIANPSTFIQFEEKVKVDKTNFIDVHIPTTKVIIEQKSLGKDLHKGIAQSDGSVLTPFQQAKRYSAELRYSQRPRWIVTCNFAEFLVYDMERPHDQPEQIWLKDLGKEYYRLRFLVDEGNEHLNREMRVSMQAGEIVGQIYDALLKQYLDPSNPQSLKSLNVLCVRIVFCLYAEDAGIFGRHDMFHDFLSQFASKDLRKALIDLFKTLDTPIGQRDPYLEPELAAFPYVNGGLFADEQIEIPRLTDEIRQLLLQNASLDFDWSEISPTIFGAVFENTLNPETRHSGGMHYTSIENIHKVIDPLFLNDLRHELDAILDEKNVKKRNARLEAYQEKISTLTFLDPACGSGNFLTEAYLSLRRLENRAIESRYQGQGVMGAISNPVRVSINQFYGIEINDFAVAVATTALWISEAQMLAETERIVQHDIDFLPLKSYNNIREGNALRMDWDVIEQPLSIPTIRANTTYLITEDEPLRAGEPEMEYGEIKLITSNIRTASKPKETETTNVHYDYIMGNPPFQGYSLQSKEQKADVLSVYTDEKGKPYKTAGKIDYVACWYMRAMQVMAQHPQTRAAFVSTNSICQGEQVSSVWKPLVERYGLHIDFAYRTFRWDSESNQKAHVHCVIVGFHSKSPAQNKDGYRGEQTEVTNCMIFDGDEDIRASHINPYLMDAPDLFIESRNKPLCDVPAMQKGSIPVDDGNLIIEATDYDEFIRREPLAVPYIRRFVGAKEFLHNEPRYCLWLENVSPHIINNLPLVKQRVQKTRDFRMASSKEATRQYADYSSRFMEIRQPIEDYIIVPSHSSENRQYIPLGFLSPDIIASNANLIIPNASLYHFGVLTSSVHMAWMRVVCGRLKSDYRYSKDIVYNNFPWPTASEAQLQKIEKTAQAILDARTLYPDASLADLYDELTMPIELRKAHKANDHAVAEAYGFDPKMTESEIVAALFKRYQELCQQTNEK